MRKRCFLLTRQFILTIFSGVLLFSCKPEIQEKKETEYVKAVSSKENEAEKIEQKEINKYTHYDYKNAIEFDVPKTLKIRNKEDESQKKMDEFRDSYNEMNSLSKIGKSDFVFIDSISNGSDDTRVMVKYEKTNSRVLAYDYEISFSQLNYLNESFKNMTMEGIRQLNNDTGANSNLTEWKDVVNDKNKNGNNYLKIEYTTKTDKGTYRDVINIFTNVNEKVTISGFCKEPCSEQFNKDLSDVIESLNFKNK